ncbi:MAG: nucleotidyltransferase family protein [Oscillospiraceae bacterium]|nr:nucleotidyltransferase family protein [Oscillospiraceae bacterium]
MVAGIICEYNPFHLGHLGHFEKTRSLVGGDCKIVCVMSGNFVQRGEPAVFCKHARAAAAVRCGADLVVELPTPYALSSAKGFARAGVHILDSLGVCDVISFGSETGDIKPLIYAAEAIGSDEADALVVHWLGKGLPYALAQQKAADAVMGSVSDVFRSPNNLLGIEYLKAVKACNSPLRPLTVVRTGGKHDGDVGCSASRLRKMLLCGDEPWESMPCASAQICMEELRLGRGPVSFSRLELAMMSRLRCMKDFSSVPDATEGLDRRFAKFAASEPTVEALLGKIKTKRYAMSRIRRMLMCASLGITSEDAARPPPYIRVLAVNDNGRALLNLARKKAQLPIITKPASAHKLPGHALEMFNKEAAATDFYVLGFKDAQSRIGGSEWRRTPVIK